MPWSSLPPILTTLFISPSSFSAAFHLFSNNPVSKKAVVTKTTTTQATSLKVIHPRGTKVPHRRDLSFIRSPHHRNEPTKEKQKPTKPEAVGAPCCSYRWVQWKQSIVTQYRRRLQADPNFLSKSIIEVILATATQLIAEFSRRGAHCIIPEIDFVVAGVLTAIAGKYYSMWRVAPTVHMEQETTPTQATTSTTTDTGTSTITSSRTTASPSFSPIPTNAFQTDRPYSLLQRTLAFILPMPSLFQAGFLASAIGYGFTAFLIIIRSCFWPAYQPATVNVNLVLASLYTGAFVALISNARYQLLQGIIEPQIVERFLYRWPSVKSAVIFAVRLANGLLGSSLAIMGMKWFGLQKLK